MNVTLVIPVVTDDDARGNSAGEAGRLLKTIEMPYPPFVGLQIDIGNGWAPELRSIRYDPESERTYAIFYGEHLTTDEELGKTITKYWSAGWEWQPWVEYA